LEARSINERHLCTVVDGVQNGEGVLVNPVAENYDVGFGRCGY
jgi:hypothetical protein